MDEYVNQNGKSLIELCKVTGLKIVNGRVGHDRSLGEYTCRTGMGQSCIDFCIISPILFCKVDNFSVDNFDRALSNSHSGIKLQILGNKQTKTVNVNSETKFDTKCSSYSTFQLKWDEHKIDEFKANFDIEMIDVIHNQIGSLNP